MGPSRPPYVQWVAEAKPPKAPEARHISPNMSPLRGSTSKPHQPRANARGYRIPALRASIRMRFACHSDFRRRLSRFSRNAARKAEPPLMPREAHPYSLSCSNSRKNSRFPSLPVIGDSHSARKTKPILFPNSAIFLIDSRCSSSSRTIPPLPTLPRPTSN